MGPDVFRQELESLAVVFRAFVEDVERVQNAGQLEPGEGVPRIALESLTICFGGLGELIQLEEGQSERLMLSAPSCFLNRSW